MLLLCHPIKLFPAKSLLPMLTGLRSDLLRYCVEMTVTPELNALFVEPTYWRMGIGRALVDHCSRHAKLDGSKCTSCDRKSICRDFLQKLQIPSDWCDRNSIRHWPANGKAPAIAEWRITIACTRRPVGLFYEWMLNTRAPVTRVVISTSGIKWRDVSRVENLIFPTRSRSQTRKAKVRMCAGRDGRVLWLNKRSAVVKSKSASTQI